MSPGRSSPQNRQLKQPSSRTYFRENACMNSSSALSRHSSVPSWKLTWRSACPNRHPRDLFRNSNPATRSTPQFSSRYRLNIERFGVPLQTRSMQNNDPGSSLNRALTAATWQGTPVNSTGRFAASPRRMESSTSPVKFAFTYFDPRRRAKPSSSSTAT